MKVPRQIIETVDAKCIRVHAKVCDSGSYDLLGPAGEVIANREDYVPGFFPSKHHGDYLDLVINLETGVIENWEKPSPEDVSRAFGILKEDE